MQVLAKNCNIKDIYFSQKGLPGMFDEKVLLDIKPCMNARIKNSIAPRICIFENRGWRSQNFSKSFCAGLTIFTLEIDPQNCWSAS